MKNPLQLTEELGDSISGVLSSEGEFVSKWVAVAEVIDANGRRWLRTFWPASSTPWDSIGMLSVAMNDMDDVDWDSAGDCGDGS